MINNNISAVGKPLCRQLTELEKSLFMSSSFTIPAHSSVVIYGQLYLKQSGRIISCKNKSKSTLRDNTGLVYSDSSGLKSYGQLLNIILLEDGDCQGFVTAISLCRSGVTICEDLTTNAGVDDHIICLLSPRYFTVPTIIANNHACFYYFCSVNDVVLIPVSSIIDKCMLLNTENEHVYASHLPNHRELD